MEFNPLIFVLIYPKVVDSPLVLNPNFQQKNCRILSEKHVPIMQNVMGIVKLGCMLSCLK